MFDVEATKRFYLDYLGCQLDWEEGEGDCPVFMQVSRGPLVLNLSSHHGDGTPGTAVLVVIDDVEALHAELRDKGYPFMSPGIEPHGVGRENGAARPRLQPDSVLPTGRARQGG